MLELLDEVKPSSDILSAQENRLRLEEGCKVLTLLEVISYNGVSMMLIKNRIGAIIDLLKTLEIFPVDSLLGNLSELYISKIMAIISAYLRHKRFIMPFLVDSHNFKLLVQTFRNFFFSRGIGNCVL